MSETLRQFWRPEMPYLIGVAVALAFLLGRFRPLERARYRNTLSFFFLGMAGELASALAQVMGYARIAEVLFAAFMVVTSIALVRLGGFSVFRLLLPLVRVRAPRIVEDLVLTGAYGLLALIHLRGAGLDLGGILATSAIVTAVLAFAMQDTLGNVLGGLALQLDHSVRVGDWIKVDDVVGRVSDIRWRFTSVETRNWETVVVPNSSLMKAKFRVLGKREGAPVQLRRWINFLVDPTVPPARVIAVAEAAIREAEIPGVAQDPKPNCVLLGFEEGDFHFALRYFLTDLARDDPTDSNVRVHLYTAFQRIGIRFAEPQQTVHLVQEDEAYAQAARRRELERRLVAVKGVDLFSTLSEAERTAVVERLQYAPFARGEVITRQGNTSHWLYILVSGEADILHETQTREGELTRVPVGKVSAGGFFGEMGLLTGAPRTATVIAQTDVECYRLDREAFRGLLTTRPQIAEEISRVMNAREHASAEARSAAALAASRREERADLLESIRRFFGLAA